MMGTQEHIAAWSGLYERLGAEKMVYGPALADGSVVEVAESFDRFEAEYAAIRQRVGVIHLPQRAVLHLTGADVQDYLHRLCTQEINGLEGGQTVRAFQLNEKGQIAADLIVHHGDPGGGGSTWLEMDVFDLPWVQELIEARRFTEDVTAEDWAEKRTLLWLLGPAAVRLLGAVAADGEAAAAVGGSPGTHRVLSVPLNDGAAARCTAYRWDLGGVLGVRLAVPTDRSAAVYAALLAAAGYEPGGDGLADAAYAERRRASMRGRPVGWSAFNTVRIEEGVPWYHVDFGRDSLPAEVPGPCGIDGAVSFTKGCYLGQEVVARMKSLGHPKKLLVGLRFEGAAGDEALKEDAGGIPVAGAQVLEPGEKQKVIGGVTSSTASALRGQAGIGMAVVRWGRHTPGTRVRVPAGGRLIDAEVVGLNELLAAG
ncbi:MAG: glycine cleavage T C-terminal barrel domain-containing protein [Planctomycetota bacterium]